MAIHLCLALKVDIMSYIEIPSTDVTHKFSLMYTNCIRVLQTVNYANFYQSIEPQTIFFQILNNV